jgi:CO/xanthine dehydrogenase FAD-binding subunit
LFDSPDIPEAFRDAILAEASHNLRQVATLAGTLVAADGRSPLTTAMLALDSKITIFPGKEGGEQETVDIGDLLPFREEHLSGRLVTQVTIPLNICLVYQSVSRTLQPANRLRRSSTLAFRTIKGGTWRIWPGACAGNGWS